MGRAWGYLQPKAFLIIPNHYTETVGTQTARQVPLPTPLHTPGSSEGTSLNAWPNTDSLSFPLQTSCPRQSNKLLSCSGHRAFVFSLSQPIQKPSSCTSPWSQQREPVAHTGRTALSRGTAPAPSEKADQPALDSVSPHGQLSGGGHSRIFCPPQRQSDAPLCYPHAAPAKAAPPRGLTSASEPLWTDFTTTALFFSSMSKP